MKAGWIIYNHSLEESRTNQDLIRSFLKAGSDLDLDLRALSNRDLVLDIEGGLSQLGGLALPSWALFYDKDPLLAQALEEAGVRVFNPPGAIETCDSKIRTHWALRGLVPQPRTLIPPLAYFRTPGWEAYAQAVMDLLGQEVIVKEDKGSWGLQVHLVSGKDALLEKISELDGRPFLIQEYLESSRGRDIRVLIVGGRILGAILRENKEDFRSNISQGGQARPIDLDPEAGEIALRAHKTLGLAFSGVDLLLGPSGHLVCEVNSNPYFLGFEKATGIPVAKEILSYIVSQT